jgi:membrane protein
MATEGRRTGGRRSRAAEPAAGWRTYGGPEAEGEKTAELGHVDGPASGVDGRDGTRKRYAHEREKARSSKRRREPGDEGYVAILKRAFKDFSQDECPRMAAAISYYTLFSMPPLLVLILMLTGVFVDSSLVEQRIQTEMAGVLGSSGAGQVHEIITAARRPGDGGVMAAVMSVAALLFGATGAFMELQKALNRAWEVEPDPKQKGGVVRIVVKRMLSLGMVATIGFLLLVSLAASAAVSAFGDRVGAMLPGGVSSVLLQVVQMVLSLAVVTVLFALMFKLLPDAKSAWKDVWIGALFTAVLFTAGKFGIGLYLAKSDPGKAFGAAGSLALILVWVYYSAMIVFLGAEFTQVRAVARGGGIEPDEDAVKVLERPKERERAAKEDAASARPGDGRKNDADEGEQAAAKKNESGKRWSGRPRSERTRPSKSKE